MSPTIAVSGLLDVSFSRIEGVPSETGSILLRGLNSDERTLSVSLALEPHALVTNESDGLTICDNGQTRHITDAEWPGYQGRGAQQRACPQADGHPGNGGDAEDEPGPPGIPHADAAAVSPPGGASTCPERFTLEPGGRIRTTADSTVTATNLRSLVTFGRGGPAVPVRVCLSTTGGAAWSPLYGDERHCPDDAEAVPAEGTDTGVRSIAAGADLAVLVNGRYTRRGWLTFDASYTSVDGRGHVVVLPGGSTVPDHPGYRGQTGIRQFLASRNLADADGTLTTGPCSILVLAELGMLNGASADFQDDVLLLEFE
jgi:hypothetical protein